MQMVGRSQRSERSEREAGLGKFCLCVYACGKACGNRARQIASSEAHFFSHSLTLSSYLFLALSLSFSSISVAGKVSFFPRTHWPACVCVCKFVQPVHFSGRPRSHWCTCCVSFHPPRRAPIHTQGEKAPFSHRYSVRLGVVYVCVCVGSRSFPSVFASVCGALEEHFRGRGRIF